MGQVPLSTYVLISLLVFAFALAIALMLTLIKLEEARSKAERLEGELHLLQQVLRTREQNIELQLRAREAQVRQDALQRSRAVISGKIAETFLPYLPWFPYNPQDARFIGSPIDFIVFDGLSAGDLKQIVIVEVKKRRNGALSERQEAVARAVREGRVVFVRLSLDDVLADRNPSHLA